MEWLGKKRGVLGEIDFGIVLGAVPSCSSTPISKGKARSFLRRIWIHPYGTHRVTCVRREPSGRSIGLTSGSFPTSFASSRIGRPWVGTGLALGGTIERDHPDCATYSYPSIPPSEEAIHEGCTDFCRGWMAACVVGVGFYGCFGIPVGLWFGDT